MSKGLQIFLAVQIMLFGISFLMFWKNKDVVHCLNERQKETEQTKTEE